MLMLLSGEFGTVLLILRKELSAEIYHNSTNKKGLISSLNTLSWAALFTIPIEAERLYKAISCEGIG